LSGATYTVKRGDNLFAIAARFGTTTKVLIELNDLADPRQLKIGQVLILP
jgi:LysM repeat protein